MNTGEWEQLGVVQLKSAEAGNTKQKVCEVVEPQDSMSNICAIESHRPGKTHTYSPNYQRSMRGFEE